MTNGPNKPFYFCPKCVKKVGRKVGKPLKKVGKSWYGRSRSVKFVARKWALWPKKWANGQKLKKKWAEKMGKIWAKIVKNRVKTGKNGLFWGIFG